ncbi:MAG: anti-sigma factor family protein [Spirochaetota bacterium]
MCPNDQILSAYFDSEIELPHRQRVTEHIAGCSSCGDKVDSYNTTRNLMRSDEVPALDESRERVLKRIYAEKAGNNEAGNTFWRKKVVLPAPLAAAAGILFFILVGGMAAIMMREEPSYTASVQRKPSSAIRIEGENLEEIRALLESRELVVEANFELPREKDFVIIGEPQLIPVKSAALGH